MLSETTYVAGSPKMIHAQLIELGGNHVHRGHSGRICHCPLTLPQRPHSHREALSYPAFGIQSVASDRQTLHRYAVYRERVRS
jgi:hypothetical protein